jgi:hypothetical protein
MSHQEKHRIPVLENVQTIALTLAAVLRSAGFDVTPFTQPAPQENS